MAWYNDLWDGIVNTWKDLTGIGATEQGIKSNEDLTRQQLQLLENQNKQANAIAKQNLMFQYGTAKANLGLQAQQFDYQKRLNAMQMQREDTAMQRQIADLQAAGFSPLMASGGSPSSALNSAPAPQMDISGISAAQGSYLDLAKQFAALKQETLSNSANRKASYYNQLASNKQASTFALANLVRGAYQDLNTRYWQAQNFRVNAEHTMKQNELLDEQIESSKQQRNWMKEHGYRNEDWTQYVLQILENLKSPAEAAKDIENFLEENKDKIGKAKETVQNVIDTAKDVPEKTKEVVQNVIDKAGKVNDSFETKKKFVNGNLILNLNTTYGDKLYYKINKKSFQSYGITEDEFMTWSHKTKRAFAKDPYSFLKIYKK